MSGGAKIARLDGKFDLVLSKLEDLRQDNRAIRDDVHQDYRAIRDDVHQENRANRTNQWVIGFGLAALMVTIAGLFPIFFDWGGRGRDMVAREVQLIHPVK